MASFANEDPTAPYQGAGIELTPSGALVVPGGITNNPAVPPSSTVPALEDVVRQGNTSSRDIFAPTFQGNVVATQMFSDVYKVPIVSDDAPGNVIHNRDLVYNNNGTLSGALTIDYDPVTDTTTFDGNVIFNGETKILNETNLEINGPILWLGNNVVSRIIDSGIVLDRDDTGVSNVATIYDGGDGVYKIMYTKNNRLDSHITWDQTSLLPVKIYGNVEATNGFIGDATGLSNITSSAPGYYGDSRQVSQVYVDSNGRITFSNVGIDLNAVVSTSNVIQTQLQLLGGFTTGNVTATDNTLSAQFFNGDGRGLTNVFTTSNLHQVSENGNVTTNVVQFVNGFVTHVGHVGISNVNPEHQLDVGETFFVQDGDVSAVNYFGNASTLTSLTGASTGTFGNASNVSTVAVGPGGYITSISNTRIQITSDQISNLVSAVANLSANTILGTITSDQVSNLIPAVANLTANTIRGTINFTQVTGANLQTVSNGFQNNVTTNQLDLQRGLLVSNTNSSNLVLQVTGNVSATNYYGNAKYLTDTTDASPGTYGSTIGGALVQLPVFTISSGRLSNVNTVPVTNLTVTNLQFTTTGLSANTTNNHVQLNNGFTVGDKMSVSNSTTSTNVLSITGNTYISNKLQVGASGNVVINPSASNVLTVKNLSNNSTTNFLVWDRTTGAVGVNVGGNFGGATFRESVTFAFRENSTVTGVLIDAGYSSPVIFFQNPFASITYLALSYCYENSLALPSTIAFYDVSSLGMNGGKLSPLNAGTQLCTPLTINIPAQNTIAYQVFSATTSPALPAITPAANGRNVAIRFNIGGNNNSTFRILSIFIGLASST